MGGVSPGIVGLLQRSYVATFLIMTVNIYDFVKVGFFDLPFAVIAVYCIFQINL